ncbi:acylneuraminate cytidylyltransferase, partial [bacterium]|nr:acylneuraminate cytidylyltransferase [bacterium]
MNKLNCKLYSGFNGATFRVDGGTDIGLGHVIGALRLAKLLKDEIGVYGIFRIRKSEVVEKLILQKGFRVDKFIFSSPEKDIESTIDFALQNHHKAIIINFCKRDIDTYSNLFHCIRQSGLRLIFQDNPVPPSYRKADLLINALPHPHYNGYEPNKHPACYDGLEYFIVDDVHERLHTKSRIIHKEAKRVLVAMGGGDMDNMTADVLLGLQKANYRGKVDVVLGAANPHKKYVQNAITRTGLDATISQNVADLPDRIILADIGFSALGLTTYEMGYLGLPVLLITRDA